MFDTVIIGAGPAGSLLASLLGNDGKKVLLIEQSETPKYKAWSGFLSRRAEKELWIPVPLSIMDKQIKTILFQLEDRKFPIFFEERFGTTMDRLRFDVFLREMALSNKNVSVKYGKVVDSKAGFERCTTTMSDGEVIESRFLVGADGYKSIVSHSVFQYKFDVHELDYIALFENVSLDTSKYRDDTVHFQVGDMESYSYRIIFPFHRNYIIREGLNTDKAEIGELISSLRTENESEDDLLIQTLVRGSNGGKNGKLNAILIGDAARLLDPITGEWLSNAFYSAKMAYQAIKEVSRKTDGTYLWDVYDKLMSERYNEIALKMLWFKDLACGDILKKADESLIRDYVDTVMWKVPFKTFFFKHSLRKFPREFFRGLFI